MFFKNFSNTINNTLNRPSKLLRLDSTGETTKENGDFIPTVQVISSQGAKVTDRKSGFDFSPQQSILSLGLSNYMGSCGLMNSFSGRLRGREREVKNKDVEIMKMPCENMKSAEAETRSWRSWPNHGRTPKTHQNGFWTNSRNFNSFRGSYKPLKVPANSPWLRVDSGYVPAHKGSYNNYHSHFWGARNNFCDKNNSSDHRIKTKHKKITEENCKITRDMSSHSSLDEKPVVCDVHSKGISEVNSKGISEVKSVIKDCDSSILVKPTVSDVCNKSEETVNVASSQINCVSEEVGNQPSESESRIQTLPEIINVSYSIDSCVADLFQDIDSNPSENLSQDAKEIGNIQIQCQSANQKIDVREMDASSTSASQSAINRDPSIPNSRPSQIHLSIIGGRCQSKQQTPPTVSNQSKINQNCQSNKTPPIDSTQQHSDAKSAQEKTCSLCTAYISRVDPKCTEFPKSAGCKHSMILLRVRDSPKKNKKRKNIKEKVDAGTKKASPTSFIVGVNSTESPEKSHIFQFIADECDSDDSWDSFDEDEDEVDSAACDRSKLEMDKLFPGSNGLFNPINFKVRISQSDSETSNPSSPTNKYLESINLSWNIQIVDNKSNHSPCPQSKTQKKVRFEDDEKLTKVYPMVAWSYAYRASRKGPWEEYARDRERFHRKIQDLEIDLSQILTDSHRSKVYNSLCDKID